MNSSKADAKVVADEQNMQRTKENNQLLFEEFDNPSESYKHDGLEWKSMGEFLTAKKIQLLEGSRAFRDWEQGRTKPGVRSSAAFFD
jgi:hypothetical protein